MSLRDRILHLNCWRRGDQRAPHKPLLLLLALGRWHESGSNEFSYASIEADLRRLLRTYGPGRASYHPEYPFWRLQNDGIWEVQGSAPLQSRKSNTDPPVSELRAKDASGRFTEAVQQELATDHHLVADIAGLLLWEHFPSSLHESILIEVGLPTAETWAPRTADEPRATRLREVAVRDPNFAKTIMEAYDHACAVCGIRPALDEAPCGNQAAHVQWHSHNGPDVADNGLALCPLHHTALDLGLIGIEQGRVVVSARLTGGEQVRERLVAFHNQPYRPPRYDFASVADCHAEWHREQVFKGPAVA